LLPLTAFAGGAIDTEGLFGAGDAIYADATVGAGSAGDMVSAGVTVGAGDAVSADDAGGAGIAAVIADTASYIMKVVTDPGIGQVGGDWAIIGLIRSGAQIPDSYVRAYYNKAAGQIAAVEGVLSTVRYSDYSRVSIAMSAIGADPGDVGGYDLLAPLADNDATMLQGINGPIFALVALAGAGYGDDPVVERHIGTILERQLADGGFTLSGTISDPDTTAMALAALSHYRSRKDVADAIDRAVSRLSKLQHDTGGFTSFLLRTQKACRR